MNDRASSSKRSGLIIDFRIKDDMCNFFDDDTQCLPNAEFQEYISSKFIVMLQNKRRFLTDKYDGPPISEESVLTWIDFPKIQTKTVLSVKETHISHHDSLFGMFGVLTQKKDKAFTLEISQTILKDTNAFTR